MLNELNFQRRKEVSYYTQPSEDSIKTIYDYILKQDSTIQSLEKEINNIKLEYSTLKCQLPHIQLQLQNKISKNEAPLFIESNTQRQSTEDIKSAIMAVLCSNDFHSHSFLQLKNEFIEHKKLFDNFMLTINQKLSSIEMNNKEEKKTPTKDMKQSDNNLADFIIKSNKGFDNSIKSLRDEYSIQFSRINKKFTEFDNDFDRLIESLKTQFQTVNETLNQLKDNSAEMTKYNEAIKSSLNIVNNEIIKDIYESMNTLKEETQRNESIMSSLSKIRTQEPTTDKIKNEMINLRKEINDDFDLINNKILDHLQNQEGEIKELYNLIENYQHKELNCLSNQEDPIQLENESGEALMTLEQEIDKKANIEQLNYAMEAQAKINEALCAVNRTARWSWSNGEIDKKGMILWGVQNINTSLDLFVWNNDRSLILITFKGIYKISAGIICSKYSRISILINGIKVITSSDTDQKSSRLNIQEDNLISLSEYYALSEGSKVQIGILLDETNKGLSLMTRTECFLEIIKII